MDRPSFDDQVTLTLQVLVRVGSDPHELVTGSTSPPVPVLTVAAPGTVCRHPPARQRLKGAPRGWVVRSGLILILACPGKRAVDDLTACSGVEKLELKHRHKRGPVLRGQLGTAASGRLLGTKKADPAMGSKDGHAQWLWRNASPVSTVEDAGLPSARGEA